MLSASEKTFLSVITAGIKSALHPKLQELRDRLTALEVQAKYLVPASQKNRLASLEPEIIAAREVASELIAEKKQLADQNFTLKRLIERQNEQLELGELSISALRSRVSKLESEKRVMGLDATQALTLNRKPVTRLRLGSGKTARKRVPTKVRLSGKKRG